MLYELFYDYDILLKVINIYNNNNYYYIYYYNVQLFVTCILQHTFTYIFFLLAYPS